MCGGGGGGYDFFFSSLTPLAQSPGGRHGGRELETHGLGVRGRRSRTVCVICE